MGEIHDLHCTKCGYGIKANTGIGMLYSPENVFKDKQFLLDLVDNPKIVDQTMDLLTKGYEINEDYGHAIYACPNDFYLFDKFYFQLKGTKEFEPQYPCPYCQTTLKRLTFAKGNPRATRLQFVEEPGKYWHCPKCGNDELNEMAFGNWD